MTEIVVKGRDARSRVLAALSKEFPMARVERRPSEFAILKAVNTALTKEQKSMTEQQALDELSAELSKLEEEIASWVLDKKAKKSDTVEDDWSAASDDSDDDGEDDDDNGDDEDDDEDDLDKISKRTKFEAMARKIAVDDGVPTAQAMTQARLRYPDLYQGFKDIQDVTAKSYRSLVEREIAKGCSPTVAAQRVAYAYPAATRSTIAKAAGGVGEFMSRCDQQMATTGCSRTEAMATIRKQYPALFAKFRNV